MTVLIYRHRMYVDRFSVSFITLPMSGSWRGKVAAPIRFFRIALIYISFRCMYGFLLLVSAIQFLLLKTFTVFSRQILYLCPRGSRDGRSGQWKMLYYCFQITQGITCVKLLVSLNSVIYLFRYHTVQ